MKRQKGFVSLGFLAVIIAIAAITFVSGAAGAIYGVIISPKPCIDEPYAANCFCQQDEDRLVVYDVAIPKYVCESKTKFIDPDDPNWEQQAIQYSLTAIDSNYPNCNMKTCPNGEWESLIGWSSGKNLRVVETRCKLGGGVFAGTIFNVVDGSIDTVYCSDYNPVIGQPTLTLTKINTPWVHSVGFDYERECNTGAGTTTASITLRKNDPTQDATGWTFMSGTETLLGGQCIVGSWDINSVKVDCTVTCSSSSGGSKGSVFLRWSV